MLSLRNDDDYGLFEVETNMGLMQLKVYQSGWGDGYTFIDNGEEVESFDDEDECVYYEDDNIEFYENFIRCTLTRPFKKISG